MNKKLLYAVLLMIIFTVSFFVFVIAHFLFPPKQVVRGYFALPVFWLIFYGRRTHQGPQKWAKKITAVFKDLFDVF